MDDIVSAMLIYIYITIEIYRISYINTTINSY